MKVFITGGTSGIGLELAKLYLNEGATVGVCGRDLSKIPKEIEIQKNIRLYELDIKNRDSVDDAITDFAKDGIDLLITSAGRSVGKKTPKPDFEASIDVFNTNVLGTLYSFEAALKIMFEQKKGHLVAISSVAGMVGLPGASSYSASKAAVTKLCESYAVDLKKFGISITNVCPGFIDTPLTKKNRHAMPWLMDAKEAAICIKKAIEKKKVLYVFPWQMKVVITLLDKMPRFLYRYIVSKKFL